MELVKTILIADIEIDSLVPLSDALRQRHLRVIHARAAVDVLQALDKHVIDVAVLHLILTDICGVGLIPIVRHRYPEIKIIVTADQDMEDHERFVRPWGIVTFVIKPYDIGTMTECIDFAARGNGERRQGGRTA